RKRALYLHSQWLWSDLSVCAPQLTIFIKYAHGWFVKARYEFGPSFASIVCSFASIRSPLFNFSLSSSGLPGSDLNTYQEPEGTFFWYQTFPSLRWSKQVMFALATFVICH